MINKKKPCKGTGKAKGYGCGSLELNRRYGLGYSCGCFSNWLLNTDQGKEVLNKSKIRASSKVKKESERKKRKEKKQWKDKHKSIQKLIQEARKPFQKWIRKRDEDKPCISCGTYYSDIWDAGHYYKAEIYTGLIFDKQNVHKQCRKCNVFLSGNESAYSDGIVNRYGIEYMEELKEKSISHRSKKYTREELIEIKKHYQEKNKT